MFHSFLALHLWNPASFTCTAYPRLDEFIFKKNVRRTHQAAGDYTAATPTPGHLLPPSSDTCHPSLRTSSARRSHLHPRGAGTPGPQQTTWLHQSACPPTVHGGSFSTPLPSPVVPCLLGTSHPDKYEPTRLLGNSKTRTWLASGACVLFPLDGAAWNILLLVLLEHPQLGGCCDSGHSRSLLRGSNVVFRVKCLAPCLPHHKPSLHQSKFQVHREIEGKVQRAPMDPQPPMHSLPPSPPHQMERLWHLRNRQSPQRVAYLIVHSWPRTLRGSRQMCGTYPSLWSRQSFAFSRMFHRWTHTVFVRTQVFSSTGEIPRSMTVGSYGRSSTFDSSSPSPRLPSQSGCCLPTGPKPS
ncbi:zinc finger protein 664 isoform X2 [Mustela nigripes]|uniref:zinc finger protein 664 isoform X2 n=1 Tax=Mustela nigripes TaxID=77151 RepID=UPI002815600C|nr:zinc finger protein 664 isoform X2 [Mustela nigripes]